MFVRYSTLPLVVAIAGLSFAVTWAETAGSGIDLKLTLLTANFKDDVKTPYVDVVLSKTLTGLGATFQRSRYLGELPDREQLVLPPSKRDGYKIYTSPTVKANRTVAAWNDTIILRNVPPDANMDLRVWGRRKLIYNKWLGDATINIGNYSKAGTSMQISTPIKHGIVFADRAGNMNVEIEVLGTTSTKNAAFATRREGPIKWRRYHNKFVEAAVEGVWEALIGGDKGYYVYSIDLHHSEAFFGSLRKLGKPDHPTIIKANRPVTGKFATQWYRYRHSILNSEVPGESGELKDARGFFDVFDWGRFGKRYTFVVRDGFIRFSETGFEKQLDEISKHFVLGDGNQDVVFSGEMFALPADRVPESVKADIKIGKKIPRKSTAAPLAPASGSDPRLLHMTNPPSLRPTLLPVPESVETPVLVIDNGSGTFGPSAEYLPKLRDLLHANFPDMKVLAIDQFDARMKELKEAAGVVHINPSPTTPPNPAEGKPPGSPENPQGTHVVLPEGAPVKSSP